MFWIIPTYGGSQTRCLVEINRERHVMTSSTFQWRLGPTPRLSTEVTPGGQIRHRA